MHDNLTNSFRDCNDLFGLVMAYKNSKGSSLDHKLVNIEPTLVMEKGLHTVALV